MLTKRVGFASRGWRKSDPCVYRSPSHIFFGFPGRLPRANICKAVTAFSFLTRFVRKLSFNERNPILLAFRYEKLHPIVLCVVPGLTCQQNIRWFSVLFLVAPVGVDWYPVDWYPVDWYPVDWYPVDWYPVDWYPVDWYGRIPCWSGLVPSGLVPSGLVPSGLVPSGLVPSGLVHSPFNVSLLNSYASVQ